MAAFQFESEGNLVHTNDKWSIELDTKPVGLDDDTHVRLVFWDARNDGERSEYEEISRVQQLEIPVVAHGLQASGMLHQSRDEFLKRLQREWDG